VARSNVSNSLRELQGWGIVRTVHELGDRKDRFESLKDVWEMFSIILEERKRREIDPTLQMLRSCASQQDGGCPTIADALSRRAAAGDDCYLSDQAPFVVWCHRAPRCGLDV